jgi:multidrug efflux pump subunit AcrB
LRSVSLSIAASFLLLAAAFMPMDFWPGRLATLAAAFTWAWRAGVLRDVVHRISRHIPSGGRH